MKIPIVECGHCEGSGKCQCDECQNKAFGRTYSRSGHYARCCACGGAGKIAVGKISDGDDSDYYEE